MSTHHQFDHGQEETRTTHNTQHTVSLFLVPHPTKHDLQKVLLFPSGIVLPANTRARLANAIIQSLFIHPALETIICSSAEFLFVTRQISLVSLSLSCPVLPCPALSYAPSYVHTHTHTHDRACAVWLRVEHDQFQPDSRHRFVSVAQIVWAAAASPQPRCTSLHCTGLAALHWHSKLGLDWMGGVGLGCRAGERAKRLSYCAARLVSLSLSPLGSVHFQISTHWVPPSFPTRLSTPPPQTRLRHLYPLLNLEASLGTFVNPHHHPPTPYSLCH